MHVLQTNCLKVCECRFLDFMCYFEIFLTLSLDFLLELNSLYYNEERLLSLLFKTFVYTGGEQ